MSKQVLDIEQIEYLSVLGIDTSDATLCWCENLKEGTTELQINNDLSYSEGWIKATPTFTLEELMEYLPNYIDNGNGSISVLQIELASPQRNRMWAVSYINTTTFVKTCYCMKNDLIDAAYGVVCWCLENGYV